MKNNLEEFVRSNRSAFDDKEPSEKVWARISKVVFNQRSLRVVYWRAAAIFFMALSAFLLYPRVTETREDKLAMKEFTDVETFYVREIADKVELIETHNGVESALNGFTHDFNQLEAMYEVLKDEMNSNPSKKVQDALVLNLLIRIDLLNKQLEKIDPVKPEDGEETKEVKSV